MLVPVILSGGSGTRLWPVSRSLFPKQLHDLTGGGSLLQNTINRLQSLPELGACVVVCNQDHRTPVAAQLADTVIATQSLILESVGRNTAPAVAVAALQCLEQDPEAVMVVLSADHTIEKVDAFHDAVRRAHTLANDDLLLTFGIVPHQPHTGFGYIQRAQTPLSADDQAYAVSAFVEKPDLKTAATYVESGDYYWNSGMFVAKASVFLAELEHYRPDILSACQQAIDAASIEGDTLKVVSLGAEFEACPSESIDYAVMEKTTRAAVVPVDIGWSDVGSWLGLWEVSERDSNENAVHGDVVTTQVSRSLIRSDSRLITVAGLSDIAVVDTDDALLVTSLTHSEGIKSIVKVLQEDGRAELTEHTQTHSDWGQRTLLTSSPEFSVSRLTIAGKSTCSIQTASQASVTFTLVDGRATLAVGDTTQSLGAGGSLTVAGGQSTTISNALSTSIDIIEVQTNETQHA